MEKSIAAARCGRRCWESDEAMVRADGSREGAPAPGFARVRDCACGREMKSGGQGGAAGQPDRGRFDRGAGRAGSGAFGYGTGRRTSVAGLSSRSPW